jgi:hypothetical protein
LKSVANFFWFARLIITAHGGGCGEGLPKSAGWRGKRQIGVKPPYGDIQFDVETPFTGLVGKAGAGTAEKLWGFFNSQLKSVEYYRLKMVAPSV